MRKKLVFASILLLALAIWGGWKFLGQKNQAPQYQTARVEKGTLVSTVTASGKAITANIVSINTNASGIVKTVLVQDGEQVVVGQKLVEITLDQAGAQKNASAWSSYLLAKTNLDSAKATAYSLQSDMFTKWDTFKLLAESSTYQNSDGTPHYVNRALPQFHIPEKNWLAAEAKFKNQEAVINQAQAAINSAWLSYQLTAPNVTAPISGTISNLEVVPGLAINNQAGTTTSDQSAISQRIAVVQNESLPILTFNLTEIDIPKLKKGQQATITLDSLPDKTYTGKVQTIDKIGTTTNNVTNYPVLVQLDTIAINILPNMAANASIILESKTDILLVPSTAIQTQSGVNSTRILNNGQEQSVNVEIGIASDTQTEVVSGLAEGDEVITGTVINPTQSRSSSIFGGGFGGGALRPGGFGGGGNATRR